MTSTGATSAMRAKWATRANREGRRAAIAAWVAAAALLALPGPAAAKPVASTTTTVLADVTVVHAAAASSTTTTTFGGTTTTTMFEPVDVTGGGQFEGGFPKGSFDVFSFVLDQPRVLVAELTNGLGGCPGDSIVELRRPGAPGNCGGVYGDDLPCVAFDDDSGISLCSRLVHYVVEPGEYEIRVSAYAGKQILRYFLDVAFVEIECGNAVVELTEHCDVGNPVAGDCCSASCHYEAAGTSCIDGVFCNGTDTCSAAGTCTTHAGDPCPGPDGDGDCTETCNEAVDACSGADPNSTTCTDGLFCNGADSCSGGNCSVHAGDPCPGPDGDGDCTEVCNEAADACSAADANGTACDDGVYCNGADTCSGGECSQHAGNPCPGADGDIDCSEACDETADACTGADPNGSACEDDLFCNGDDTCLGGLCNQHTGAVCPGVDGDSNCAESCSDSEGGCTGDDPQGAPCDDGVFCNGPDTCSGGSCSVHAGNPCPGADGDGNCSESCNEGADNCTAPDANATACDDGLFCNGADTCASGACSQHAGSPCPGPDGDGNCAETCSEANDDCSASDTNGSACADGLFCNGADTCEGGFCNAHAGDPCPGADGDGDCTETCNETADACSAADPNASACDDGLFCNGEDTCLSGACSQHAGNPCQGADGDIDCSEQCNESADDCSGNDPDGAVCNDQHFCNGTDECEGGFCAVHIGNPCVGPDGDGDCAESCLESAETCTGADPDGSNCTDGLFCNGSDDCSGGSCSLHEGPACDDENPCTTDTCTETGDLCSHMEIPGCTTTTTTMPAFVCGDVNGDDQVKSSDALAVLKAAVGGNQCAAQPCVCDANGNGTLQASDALLVLKTAVGSPANLQCPC